MNFIGIKQLLHNQIGYILKKKHRKKVNIIMEVYHLYYTYMVLSFVHNFMNQYKAVVSGLYKSGHSIPD